MKICKLIRRHSFLDARVFRKQARSLAALGHEVYLLAPRYNGVLLNVNKAPLKDKQYEAPSFLLDQVTVMPYTAKSYSSDLQKAKAEKAMLRSLQQLSLPYQLDGLLVKARDAGADVYHAHEPETLYEAVQAKRYWREQGRPVSVIFDAHELEKDTPLLRELMKETDRLITVSDHIASLYAARYPQVPVVVIYNSPKRLERLAEPDISSPFTMERPMIIGYEGMVKREKGDPARMIGILDSLSQAGLHVRFKILGQGQHASRAERALIDNRLRSHPLIDYAWVDYERLGEQWSSVDVGYIYFDLGSENRANALPNKLFSLLNAGVPVVVNDAPAMAALLRKHGCGLVAGRSPSAADYAKLFAQLYHDRQLLAAMRRQALAAMDEEYVWEKMEKRLYLLYQELERQP
ncbi:glycosyltransferase [Paenibacillus sp. PL2-23]|uniref:glycosyltransferase n=1 Tax=Paenibacillus sp. PL2-23 TaxID=2100729 RepID=UPI0030FD0F68